MPAFDHIDADAEVAQVRLPQRQEEAPLAGPRGPDDALARPPPLALALQARAVHELRVDPLHDLAQGGEALVVQRQLELAHPLLEPKHLALRKRLVRRLAGEPEAREGGGDC